MRYKINVYIMFFHSSVLNALESAEMLKEDKDSGLDVLVFGADVNSDEACAQRSKSSTLSY